MLSRLVFTFLFFGLFILNFYSLCHGASSDIALSAIGSEIKTKGSEVTTNGSEHSVSPFSFGGDIRFRISGLSEVPLEADRNNGSKITDSLFTRFRTRLWAQYQINEKQKFKIRLTNEWRLYDQDRVNHTNPWKFPDEFIFDELYLDSKDHFNGKLDLKIGRQFLYYGNGRIFIEPSPLDGSRTMFSNALKAGLKVQKKHNIDFLYFDNPSIDRLAIHSSDAKLVEYGEKGGGFYAKNNVNPTLPFEYYYIYKEEDREGADGRPVYLDTYGTRLLPRFSDTVDGNFELASQSGSQGSNNIGGSMVDAFVNWNFLPEHRHKPVFSGGYFYLSGDKTGTGNDESWHPVMSRCVNYSEFYLYALINGAGGHNVGYWTNMNLLWCGIKYEPSVKTTVSVRYLKMKADETDDATYPGLGDSIGDVIVSKLKHKINKNWFGQLNYEWFRPGDYYIDSMSIGHFMRAEINYRF